MGVNDLSIMVIRKSCKGRFSYDCLVIWYKEYIRQHQRGLFAEQSKVQNSQNTYTINGHTLPDLYHSSSIPPPGKWSDRTKEGLTFLSNTPSLLWTPVPAPCRVPIPIPHPYLTPFRWISVPWSTISVHEPAVNFQIRSKQQWNISYFFTLNFGEVFQNQFKQVAPIQKIPLIP